MDLIHSRAALARRGVFALFTTTAVVLCAVGVTDAAPAAASPAPSARANPLSLLLPQLGRWGDSDADKAAKDTSGHNSAQLDPGSMYVVSQAIGARSLWNKKDRNNRVLTGQGIGVAVLDSGVNQVPGLDAAGKVTYGPDLSIEGNGPLRDQDTFGHGTFMAGLIAGRGTTKTSAELAGTTADTQLGIAPDAKLLAMKLATTDGSTDVSQIIAALDWVTEHPVMPDGTRIRVINLSYGTDSVQAYQRDPLAAAAENAWRHGIVVVTSAGNSGTSTGRLTDPAADPYVLAVGAADNNDSVNGWQASKVQVADFSNVASTGRRPDLIAPGTSVVSLRDPGSFVDVSNPQGLVAGDTTGRLFRGSGTSQAAAIVSGAVALLLQANPSLTPDQVKSALVSSASPVVGTSSAAAGAGEINLTKALDASNRLVGIDPAAILLRAAANQSYTQSTGSGSLDAARGGSVLVDPDGNDLSGEVDVMGNTWNPAAWYKASSGLTAWSGGSWLGQVWTGNGWEPSSNGLAASRWSASRWSASRWSDADWDSSRWSASRWSASRWSSSRWSASRWSGEDW